MEHEKQGYKFTLIDEPLQRHVIAWERALRAMKTEDAKPVLTNAIATLNNLSVADNNSSLLQAFQIVAGSLTEVLNILNDNETVTLNANRSFIVKAAIKAEWLLNSVTVEQVDDLPSWVVQWMAESVAYVYNRSQEIPKA